MPPIRSGARIVMRRAASGAIISVLLGLALSWCAASPTSTYVSNVGERVTVDWADYPGHAGLDAGDVLRAPSTEEVEAFSLTLLGDIERRLTADFGVGWEDGPDADGDRLHPFEGNGYGGPSMFTTFNSTTRQTESIPTRAGEWDPATSSRWLPTDLRGPGEWHVR